MDWDDHDSLRSYREHAMRYRSAIQQGEIEEIRKEVHRASSFSINRNSNVVERFSSLECELCNADKYEFRHQVTDPVIDMENSSC